MGEVASQIPASFGHELRARLRCRLVKTYDQIMDSGCENRHFFKGEEVPELIVDVTTLNFNGSSPTTATEEETKTNSLYYSLLLLLAFPDSSIGETFSHLNLRRLESESGCYFNMRYFEELVAQGKWDEMEKYLFGFTKIGDNQQSMMIFFEIRKHKYLEALDKRDHAKALDILRKDLKVFELETYNKDLFKEMSLLLTMDDFRANPKISTYGDTTSERGNLFRGIEKLIVANPLLRDKLQFPVLGTSRLRTLIGQSLKWQHHLCKNPMPNPDIDTLFVDHTCDQPIAVGNISPVPYSGQPHGRNTISLDEFPKVVVTTLAQGSPVTSMDFHPFQQILLLVGTIGGDVFLWDVVARQMISEKGFEVWKLYACSDELQGHEAPVLSVCPDQKKIIQVILSTATDGKIKGWSYDDVGASVTYDAPGHSSTRMAFSSDRARLFSCGTNKEGESFLVEWKDGKGSIKRTYQGLGQRAVGIVQFDTTKNRFLAAGDESTIKIWDMNNTNLLKTIHADGGLPASPCVRFNKEGTLLAVSTSNHGVRILATDDGLKFLKTAENRTLVTKVPGGGGGGFGSSSANAGITMADQSTSCAAMKKNEVRTLPLGKPRTSNVSNEGSTTWKVTEITEPSQCYSLILPDKVTDTKVSRLIYTNSGSGVLALASNAEHKLWKWQKSDPNLDGKATTNAHPVLWRPNSGIIMINKTSDTNPEEAIPCLALSKNDSYLVSASGREISLFKMATFETAATYMSPPPAATFLAFLPSDYNIIGIGFKDSSIRIYNLQTDEGKAILLNGHTKRITGLAFSLALNILVSSGADSQVCVWSMAGWEKRSSMYLNAPKGRSMPAVSDTRVQFHQNEIHLLVVNETQIAIYDAQKLDCLNTWFLREATGRRITSGTYSGDSKSIFVGFEDGTVNVLTASNLRLRCRINPTAYLPSNPSLRVLVIAAHPSESDQFAVGLSNGHVCVVEPSESEGRWGTSPPGST
uniref:CTLH domain-containing protein n=1 Tax=Brassica campestris TaxID=3711 RepID=M4CP68_BRACM